MNRLLTLLGLALCLAVPAYAQGIPDSRNHAPATSTCLAYGQMNQAKATGGVPNVDWSARLYPDAKAWPNKTTFVWQVPAAPKVWGYLHIECGQMTNASPGVKSPVKPVSQINSILLNIDVEIAGPGEVNVLSDTFLYKDATPHRGNVGDYDFEVKQRVGELGVFLAIAPSQRAWALAQPCIRTCAPIIIGGREWLARQSGVYLMYFPAKGEYLTGSFNLKDHLDHAAGGGIAWAAGATYFGTAFGVEPITLGGLGVVKSFALDVK